MKPITGLIVAVVFIVGCLAGGAMSNFVVPKVRAGTNPQKWEYKCVLIRGPLTTTDANRMGASGWEMSGNTENNWCFKRPLP